MLKRYFELEKLKTDVRTEVLAGVTSFVTIMYIIVTNAAILSDAGIPFDAAILSTIFISAFSTIVMGIFAKTPFVVVPGMGVNALFTYTIVQSMGLTWQEALAVVFVSGILFTILSLTSVTALLLRSIPRSLKQAITVGVGILILFIGLQKSGFVISNASTLIGLGDIGSKEVLITIFTLLLIVVLHIRNVRGNLLISLVLGTIIGIATGVVDTSVAKEANIQLSQFNAVFAQMNFTRIGELTFWIAVFSVTIVVVFENMGLIYGQTELIKRKDRFKSSFQVTGISNTVAGLFGSSPTIVSVESVSGIAVGGKSGLTAVTTGILFLFAIAFIPLMKLVPDSAVGAILIFVGVLMIQTITELDFREFSDALPAIIIITFIPLTYSIVDGIAFGFILYPIIKIACKKYKEVPTPMYVIAGLFIINFALHALATAVH